MGLKLQSTLLRFKEHSLQHIALVVLILTTATSPTAAQLSSSFNIAESQLSFVADVSQSESDMSSIITLSKPASPKTAMRYSLLSTLLPVTAGVLIFVLNGPDSVFAKRLDGTIYSWGEQDPDRALPVFLIWGGVTVGPSMGYFYGNKSPRAVGGIIMRNVLLFGGIAAAFAICPENCSSISKEAGFARIVLVTSLGLVMISAFHDIASVEQAVIKENAKRGTPYLSVRPWLSTDYQPTGISLTLRF